MATDLKRLLSGPGCPSRARWGPVVYVMEQQRQASKEDKFREKFWSGLVYPAGRTTKRLHHYYYCPLSTIDIVIAICCPTDGEAEPLAEILLSRLSRLRAAGGIQPQGTGSSGSATEVCRGRTSDKWLHLRRRLVPMASSGLQGSRRGVTLGGHYNAAGGTWCCGAPLDEPAMGGGVRWGRPGAPTEARWVIRG